MPEQTKQAEKSTVVRINIGAQATERGPIGKFVELANPPTKLSEFPKGTIREIVENPRAIAAQGRIGVIAIDGQKFYVTDDRPKPQPAADKK